MLIRYLFLSLVGACSMYAQSSTPISCPSGLAANCFAMEAQAVPASPTVITTHALTFGGGWISCTGTQTITLTDGNSKALIPTVAWVGPQVISLNLFAGSYVSGGLTITASATGCTYHMWWRQ